MDARCRIELLGRLRVTRGEHEIMRFRAQKPGALLGYLADQSCGGCLLPAFPPPSWVESPTHLTCLAHGCCFTRTPARPHVAHQVEDRSGDT